MLLRSTTLLEMGFPLASVTWTVIVPDCRPALTVVAGVVKVIMSATLAPTVSVCWANRVVVAASAALMVGVPAVASS